MNQENKHLKYIAHGIYLQIFLGLGFLSINFVESEPPSFITDSKTSGYLLIFLGLNSLIYINKFKKSLSKQQQSEERNSNPKPN